MNCTIGVAPLYTTLNFTSIMINIIKVAHICRSAKEVEYIMKQVMPTAAAVLSRSVRVRASSDTPSGIFACLLL